MNYVRIKNNTIIDFSKLNTQKTQNIFFDYHYIAFIEMQKEYETEIYAELIKKPRSIKSNYIKRKFEINKLYGVEIWQDFKYLLELIENAMRQTLHFRSVIFWLHVYRRIGVTLHPDHENRTDPTTVALVRQIAELAIAKYARAESATEIDEMAQIPTNILLGGLTKKYFLKKVKPNSKEHWNNYEEQLKSSNGWGLKEFTKRDLLNIYHLEGLAYQYWIVTALMRSLGKNRKVTFNKNGEWEYVYSQETESLILSYDNRAEIDNELSSLSGIWVPTESPNEEIEYSNYLITPFYNTKNETENIETLNSHKIDNEYIGNFLVGSLSINNFIDKHYIMLKPFKEKYGFDLQEYLTIIKALTSIMTNPNILISESNVDKIELLERTTFVNITKRAYASLRCSNDELASAIQERLSLLNINNISNETTDKILEFISLRTKNQESIGIWSGGPRPLIIPSNNHQLFDAVGIIPRLRSIFAFLKHDAGSRGFSFEKTFRETLVGRGYDVIFGEKKTKLNNKREIDAGVIISDTLYLFECISIERPLDYEIGNPKTFEIRNKLLEDKLEQAITANDFFSSNPLGTNYDFTNKKIEHFVVSPFIEWVWSRDQKYWHSPHLPRIISAAEAISLLEAISS